MKKVVIFARVSSTNGTQDYERQINDLQTLASANNWTVEAVFAEKVSGAKKNNIPELQSYLEGTCKDIEAVKNSIIYQYNNGLAEGNVNKLKL